MSATRLALGTVQFGLDYGINNKNGKVSYTEVLKILSTAKISGIDTLDTASAYGDAEKVIGNALCGKDSFRIISKTNASGSVSASVRSSLANLQLDTLYGYLFHDIRHYNDNKESYNDLVHLRESGIIKKLGFSLYHTSDLEKLLHNKLQFDLVQVPYNIFDTRFERYFNQLKDHGVEIHTRSAFLQGLFFKDPFSVSDHFDSAKEKLRQIHDIAAMHNLSVAALSLCYCLLNNNIDKVVIGVDSEVNLKENILALQQLEKVRGLMPQLETLRVSDEKIILPFNWPK